MIMRPDKDMYFLTIAHAVSLRSTCKSRNIGCVLIDHNYHILSTGYNGPASGQSECDPCLRQEKESGIGLLDSCNAVHAEQNALLQCPSIDNIYTAYVITSPCLTCVKLLMNTKCKRIVFIHQYPHIMAKEMWLKSGGEWINYVPNADIMDVFDMMTNI